MNKNEFLRRLEIELSILDKVERKELMDFYEERFYNGIYYENKSEQEVVEELETPRVIAKNILDQYGIKPKHVSKPEERYEGVKLGSLVWLGCVDLFFLSWLIPTLFGITVALFGSVLGYIPMFTLIIGEKTQYDVMIFWFATGLFILLFNFALVILDLFIWTLKKSLKFHLDTFKVRRRAEFNKKMNRINVDSFIKKRKKLMSIKRLTFMAAVLLVGIFGFRLAINADNIYGLYVNQISYTDVETVDVLTDINDETPWSIDVDVDNMQIVFVVSDTNEIIVSREYQEDPVSFTMEINEDTNTITVEQENDYESWNFNFDWNLEEILRMIKPDILTIEVPEGLVINATNLYTMNGSIEVVGVSVEELIVENSNGDIRVEDVMVDSNVNITSFNSNISIENVTGSGLLSVDTSNGRIYVTESDFNRYDLETSNGKIRLEELNVLNKDGVKLDAQTSNGRITLHNVYVSEVDLDTSNGDIIYNNDDQTFDVDYSRNTSNGDIEGNVN